MKDNTSRRRFLKTGALIGLSATAGCIEPLSSSGEKQEPFSHPSTDRIDNQPYIGPEPSVDKPIIVGFEDFACPSCARFHNNALRELRDTHINDEELTFVFRAVDFIYNWGGKSAQVQEAVHDNNSEKVFDVIDDYYSRQNQISASNEVSQSRQILKDNSVENASDIIQQVTEDDYQTQLMNDEVSARESGARATPTLSLIENGRHKTNVVGAKNAAVFENILNL